MRTCTADVVTPSCRGVGSLERGSESSLPPEAGKAKVIGVRVIPMIVKNERNGSTWYKTFHLFLCG